MKNGVQKEDFRSSAYKTLASARIAYIASMTSIGDLYKKKQITEAQKSKVIESATEFVRWYDIAAQSLVVFDKAQTAVAQVQAQDGLNKMGPALAGFLEIVTPLIKISADLTGGK